MQTINSLNWVIVYMMRRYEIRDDQWDKIKDLLPPARKPQGGRPGVLEVD
jgi:hypothetical protein